jgi:hypothetical protein
MGDALPLGATEHRIDRDEFHAWCSCGQSFYPAWDYKFSVGSEAIEIWSGLHLVRTMNVKGG